MSKNTSISNNSYADIDSHNHHEYEAIKSFTYEAFKDSATVNVDEILDEVIEIWMEVFKYLKAYKY